MDQVFAGKCCKVLSSRAVYSLQKDLGVKAPLQIHTIQAGSSVAGCNG